MRTAAEQDQAGFVTSKVQTNSNDDDFILGTPKKRLRQQKQQNGMANKEKEQVVTRHKASGHLSKGKTRRGCNNNRFGPLNTDESDYWVLQQTLPKDMPTQTEPLVESVKTIETEAAKSTNTKNIPHKATAQKQQTKKQRRQTKRMSKKHAAAETTLLVKENSIQDADMFADDEDDDIDELMRQIDLEPLKGERKSETNRDFTCKKTRRRITKQMARLSFLMAQDPEFEFEGNDTEHLRNEPENTSDPRDDREKLSHKKDIDPQSENLPGDEDLFDDDDEIDDLMRLIQLSQQTASHNTTECGRTRRGNRTGATAVTKDGSAHAGESSLGKMRLRSHKTVQSNGADNLTPEQKDMFKKRAESLNRRKDKPAKPKQ
jgi:hypothetical protein